MAKTLSLTEKEKIKAALTQQMGFSSTLSNPKMLVYFVILIVAFYFLIVSINAPYFIGLVIMFIILMGLPLTPILLTKQQKAARELIFQQFPILAIVNILRSVVIPVGCAAVAIHLFTVNEIELLYNISIIAVFVVVFGGGIYTHTTLRSLLNS